MFRQHIGPISLDKPGWLTLTLQTSFSSMSLFSEFCNSSSTIFSWYSLIWLLKLSNFSSDCLSKPSSSRICKQNVETNHKLILLKWCALIRSHTLFCALSSTKYKRSLKSKFSLRNRAISSLNSRTNRPWP